MAIATVLIILCLVIGSLIAQFVVVRGAIGRAETWTALRTVGVVVGIAAFLLPAAFRWPLTHAAASLIPAECILLYLILSVYAGTLVPFSLRWWGRLFDAHTYYWFGQLNIALALPWFIGIAIASPICACRQRRKWTDWRGAGKTGTEASI